MSEKTRPHDGNGAREAVLKLVGNPTLADVLLGLLWLEGFKVVPLDADDLD